MPSPGEVPEKLKRQVGDLIGEGEWSRLDGWDATAARIIPVVEADLQERLLGDEAIQALWEHFGTRYPKLPTPTKTAAKHLREGQRAAIDAALQKGGEDQ